jgi:hypothetical protein
LNYNVDLFDAATIRRMVGHFRTLLLGIVADPEARISELPLLTAVEQKQISIEWNRTETDFPRDASINEFFEAQAVLRPEAIALEHQETRWTYRELNQRSNQIAHCLRQAGANAQSLVGICMERSVLMIAGMLAILKAGSAYVPIDPAYPAERRTLMLEGVPLLLTTKKLAAEFSAGAAHIICVDGESVLRAGRENLQRLSNACTISSTSAREIPASERQYRVALTGKSPVCFFRLNRSSAAAATNTPSTTRAAAASCPCEIRYSRSSSPGQCTLLKFVAFARPLMPRIRTEAPWGVQIPFRSTNICGPP